MTATRFPDTTEQVCLQLLDWWDLRLGDQSITLGRREQRLVALLALSGRRSRLQLASTLWPDSTEHRAMSSLRAAVWHTRQSADGLLSAGQSTLALAAHVAVDVDRLTGLAAGAAASPAAQDVDTVVSALRTGDLLPGWYDDWVLYERQRIEHLRFRALEAVARARLQSGQPNDAALAARTALEIEPLHEGANVLLVRACLASGDVVEAVRHFHAYRRQLARELGIRPSGQLADLVRPLLLPRQRDAVPPGQPSRK